jgi:hypothetical protein
MFAASRKSASRTAAPKMPPLVLPEDIVYAKFVHLVPKLPKGCSISEEVVRGEVRSFGCGHHVLWDSSNPRHDVW